MKGYLANEEEEREERRIKLLGRWAKVSEGKEALEMLEGRSFEEGEGEGRVAKEEDPRAIDGAVLEVFSFSTFFSLLLPSKFD